MQRHVVVVLAQLLNVSRLRATRASRFCAGSLMYENMPRHCCNTLGVTPQLEAAARRSIVLPPSLPTFNLVRSLSRRLCSHVEMMAT